ncbi:MAG: acyltransferase [Clostridia bacterium]|nr:acyltransferase [Clostridia bacterium]
MKFITIIKQIKRRLKGSLKIAKEDGMIVEEGVSVLGGVNFGSEPYLITLRKKCRITSDVVFVTHDGGTWAFRNHWEKYKDVIKYGKIEVGEEAFIGTRSIIMPGVRIGNHSVVGAGSVVTKDVPDYTVVAGVPAKVICTTQEYAERSLAGMPDGFNKLEYDTDKKSHLLNIL